MVKAHGATGARRPAPSLLAPAAAERGQVSEVEAGKVREALFLGLASFMQTRMTRPSRWNLRQRRGPADACHRPRLVTGRIGRDQLCRVLRLSRSPLSDSSEGAASDHPSDATKSHAGDRRGVADSRVRSWLGRRAARFRITDFDVVTERTVPGLKTRRRPMTGVIWVIGPCPSCRCVPSVEGRRPTKGSTSCREAIGRTATAAGPGP
jgi:hypothetical protein